MTRFMHDDTTVYHPSDMDYKTALQWLGLELKKNVPYRLWRLDINYHDSGGLIIRPHYDTRYRTGGV